MDANPSPPVNTVYDLPPGTPASEALNEARDDVHVRAVQAEACNESSFWHEALDDALEISEDLMLDEDVEEMDESDIMCHFEDFIRLASPSALREAVKVAQILVEKLLVDAELRNRYYLILHMLRKRYNLLEQSAAYALLDEAGKFEGKHMVRSREFRTTALYIDPSLDFFVFPQSPNEEEIKDLEFSVGVLLQAAQIVKQLCEQESDSEPYTIVAHKIAKDLRTEYIRTGAENVFNISVDLIQFILGTCWNQKKQVDCFAELSTLYYGRYSRTGSLNDLDYAIKLVHQAVGSPIQDIWNSMRYRIQLSALYGVRFSRTQGRNSDDLKRGLKEARAVVNEIQDLDIVTSSSNSTSVRPCAPSAKQIKGLAIVTLGELLYRSWVDEPTTSLNDCIMHLRLALKLLEVDPFLKCQEVCSSGVSALLGSALAGRFETGTPRLREDIEEAIDVLNPAKQFISWTNDTGYVNALRSLQTAYYIQWLYTDPPDRTMVQLVEQLAPLSEESWNRIGAPLHTRISMAESGALLLVTVRLFDRALSLIEKAINEFSALSNWSVSMADKQFMLSQLTYVGSLAASIALCSKSEDSHALSLLESSRRVISGQFLDMRQDISKLKRKLPRLALQFESLTTAIASAGGTTERSLSISGKLDDSLKPTLGSNLDFMELLNTIRKEPGFHDFFLPPSRQQMMNAARKGPIVVLSTSTLRSDAFIVQSTGINALRLTNISKDEVESMAKELKANSSSPTYDIAPLLGRIWDDIASPVMEALGFRGPVTNGKWPHIWWIPTGPFNHLPLHAAGYHRLDSFDAVIDRVISSYSPSIRALICERARPLPQAQTISSDALLVSMPSTEGVGYLGAVEKEVDVLKALWPSLGFSILTPPRTKKVEVLKLLQSCKCFHFVGHGEDDLMDSLQSRLLLEDWKTNPLTASDILDNRLQDNRPFLAYLSACLTGASKVDGLVDESIHLAGAFQLAGFRHVVGTLWEVLDSRSANAARVFYETLGSQHMTDDAVALSLHTAVREMRKSYLMSQPNPESAVVHKLSGRETKPRDVAKALEAEVRSAFSAGSSGIRGGLKSGMRSSGDANMRTVGNCTAGPVEGPSAQRMYWVPYVHFGV